MQIQSMGLSLKASLLANGKLIFKSSGIRDICGLVIILYLFNPMFSFYNQMIFISFCLIWVTLAFTTEKQEVLNYLRSKVFIILLAFSIVCVIYWLLGVSLLNKHTILLPFIYILSKFYLNDKFHKTLKIYCYIVGIYIILISVITLFKLEVDPEITRLLARGDKEVIEGVISPFTATYASVYSFTLISIMLFGIGLKIKEKKIKIICFMLVLFFLYFLFKAAYSISLILLLGGFVLMLFFFIWERIEDKKRAVLILLFSLLCMLVFYLIFKDSIADFILSLIKYTEDEMQQRRLKEISELVRNFGLQSEGGMSNRFQLYFLSAETFIKNPLFGVGFRDELLHTNIDVLQPIIGGHSTTFDILASYGIFGILYISSIPIFYYDIIKKKVVSSKTILIVTLVIFLILSTINTAQNVMFYIVILWFIPGFVKTSEIKFINKEDSK